MSEIKKEENLETPVKETKAKKTPKVETKAEGKVEDKEVLVDDTAITALKKQNEDLQLKNKELENKLDALLEKISNLSFQQQPVIIQQQQPKKYTIVNLTSNHNVLFLEAGNWSGTFRGYCDTREVHEEVFYEIIRKYASFFATGDIATDAEGAKILKERGLKVATTWMTNQELRNIGKLTVEEIEALFKKLIAAQKELFVEEFLNGVARGEEGYVDINKLMAINKNYKGYKSQSLASAINNIVNKK